MPTIRIRCDGSTKGDEQLSLNLRQMMRIVDPVKFLTSFKRSKVVRWVEAWGGDGTEQTLESGGINIAATKFPNMESQTPAMCLAAL